MVGLIRKRPLTVGISAEFAIDGAAGGVASVTGGLLRALARLNDGRQRFLIIVPPHNLDKLRSYEAANMELVVRTPPDVPPDYPPPPPPPRRIRRWINRLAPSKPPARPILPTPRMCLSDGFYEELGCDVLHFPHQHYIQTSIPTVYNPHDLQHLHLPEFFTTDVLAYRESLYPFACRAATAVAVASSWIRDDLVRQFDEEDNKIYTIPWAPPTEAYTAPTQEDLRRVRKEYNLPERFAFYPAVTWPHKNHDRLIEAIAILRDQRDEPISLVCSGYHNEPEFSRLQSQIKALELGSLVQMIGYVPGSDLRAIFRLATCGVVPTLFEAASAPVFEAWKASLPVACSSVTSLPMQVGDAALLFDPYSIEEIAGAIDTLFSSSELRADLAARGQRRLNDFSWDRTARAYLALYRRLARRRLSRADKRLLGWNWMEEPNSSIN